MDELPGEMVVAVLGWVEAPGLLASRLVCRRWRHLLATPTTSGGGGGGEVWRRSYLRTWPPPLLCSAAQHAATAAARPIDWHALCLQRIGLQRHSDQEARMAEVAALLRSAATLAVSAPLGAESEGTTAAAAPADKKEKEKEKKKKRKRKVKESESESDEKKKSKSKKERTEKKKKKKKQKKRKRASSSSSGSSSEAEESKKDKKKKKKRRRVKEEEGEEAEESALQSARQRHIADVQGPMEKAQQVLAHLNRVAGLRRRAHQLLHSFGPQGKANATGEKASKEHLLTMLFHDNLLYETIYRKEIDLGDVMHSVKYEASVVVYSLVTGLPLRMTYTFHYNPAESDDELSWKSLAGGDDQLEGKVGDLSQLWRSAAKERADYAALQAFLFGHENADTIDPPTLEKFVEGVFVPADDYYVKHWVRWPQ